MLLLLLCCSNLFCSQFCCCCFCPKIELKIETPNNITTIVILFFFVFFLVQQQIFNILFFLLWWLKGKNYFFPYLFISFSLQSHLDMSFFFKLRYNEEVLKQKCLRQDDRYLIVGIFFIFYPLKYKL